MNPYQKGLAEEVENRIYEIPEFLDGDFILDEHQTEAMVEMSEGLLTGDRAFSIVHSCGSGKSALEANMLLASLKVKGQLNLVNDVPDIILTTERALIHSLEEEFKNFGIDIGVWGAGRKILDRPAVLTTIQALQQNKNDLSKILPLDRVPLILGDEADLYLTKLRKQIVTQFNNAIRVGFTATDSWPDGRDISELWGKKIHQMPLKEGITKDINVPPMFNLFEANIDEEDLEIKQGDYDQKTLSRALKEAEIQKAIPDIYRMMIPKEKRKEFPTLVYVPSIFLVHDVVENFKKQFDGEVIVKGWTGESVSSQQIQQDMKAFNEGEIDVLVLCEMGGRGINLPRARALIDGYPTLSPNKLEQRHGRPLRKVREGSSYEKEGFKKPFSLVAQIIPKSNSFRPYMLPDLLDCWDDFRKGRLLGTNDRNTGGNSKPVLGYPIQNEVKELRDYINEQKPSTNIELMKDFSILEQLELRDNLPQANKEDFFTGEDGKTYRTTTAWARTLSISQPAINFRLKDAIGVTAKSSSGNIIKKGFYAKDVVREACKDLLEEMPKANKEGFFVGENKKKYGTILAWSRVLPISQPSIGSRLKDTKGMTAKDSGGKIVTEGFHAEDIVRETCKDLLKEMPKANEGGFFVGENKKKHGTIRAWSRIFPVGEKPITSRLKNIKGMTAKDGGGKIITEGFYAEDIVREACNGLLEKMPKADEEGFFLGEDKKKHGTITAWAKILPISEPAIIPRLRNKVGITAKTSAGRVIENGFYAENVVRESCEDLLEEMSKANEEGFFIGEDKKKYGTIVAWSRILPISSPSIGSRLVGITGMTAKDSGGKIITEGFYAEDMMREACRDLLEEMPKANEEGFFLGEDKKKYGTIVAWTRILPIGNKPLNSRLKDIIGVTAKASSGNIIKNGFYAEDVVIEACKTLLDKK